MRRNIEPAFPKQVGEKAIKAAPGSVIASPSAQDPDYFFHWVRDSALVMDAVVRLYGSYADPDLERVIESFIDFSARLQRAPVGAGLGEVRFNVDGSPDTLPWSRPQFDGPALRALTLLRYQAVRRTPLPAAREQVLRDVVRRDLDFVVLHWNEPCFDVWESYTGVYYYTRAVQAGALLAAAPVVRAWGDVARASRYEQVAQRLLDALDAHWRTPAGAAARAGAADGFLAYSIGDLRDVNGVPATRPGGGLDAGVVMAAVHAGRASGRHALDDPRLLATAARLEALFEERFPINREDRHGPGTAIGRHEGDQYYGGNPFVFLTAAFAEFHYRLAASLPSRPSLVVTPESRAFWARVLATTPAAPAAVPQAGSAAAPPGGPAVVPPGGSAAAPPSGRAGSPAAPPSGPATAVPSSKVPGAGGATGVPSSRVPGAGAATGAPSSKVPGAAAGSGVPTGSAPGMVASPGGSAIAGAATTQGPAPGTDLLLAPGARERLRLALVQRGDETLAAILHYLPDDARLAEQFDKETGAPRSAMDLTWSYASVITAALARAEALALR